MSGQPERPAQSVEQAWRDGYFDYEENAGRDDDYSDNASIQNEYENGWYAARDDWEACND